LKLPNSKSSCDSRLSELMKKTESRLSISRIQIVPTGFVLTKKLVCVRSKKKRKLARPRKKLTAKPSRRRMKDLNLKKTNVCGKKRTESTLKTRSSTLRRLAWPLSNSRMRVNSKKSLAEKLSARRKNLVKI
jgi:hypothetical protein